LYLGGVMGSREAGGYEAVFFMEENQVSRQMLFTEFEALLSGLGVLPDYADEEARAVYALINQAGSIYALVFFKLYFDEDGRADTGWNVPVERLAEISGSGPDLGSGPIRLACRGQCSINWHQNDLWDPDMTPGSSDFSLLRKAVDKNRLRLVFEKPVEDVPTLAVAFDNSSEVPVLEQSNDPSIDSEKRIKLARLLKEQRLRIKTLESNQESASDSSDRAHRIELHAYKNTLQEQKQTIEKLKLLNEKFKQKLSSRDDQFIGLQDKISNQTSLVADLEEKLQSASVNDRGKLEKQKLDAQVVLLTEQLERKDIDLSYRDEREEQLRAELEELSEAIGKGKEGTSIFDKLKALEVVYVAYHPGVGHITMSALEISDYAENPMGFIANKCFVTEADYINWLAHFENPVCTHISSTGLACLEFVEKVTVPSEFEQGISGLCEKHSVHE
jgi:hypothetical protein